MLHSCDSYDVQHLTMKQLQWKIKQLLKMSVQHLLLPLIYDFWRIVYLKRKSELIIFADAHHETIPFSMTVMHDRLEQMGYSLTDSFHDYAKLSSFSAFLKAAGFMRQYARARCVFICDNFLPAASCNKSKTTKVIQLWHSCGLLKKMGYDTSEDVPARYIGNVYKNYDLVTVSAPCCIAPLTSGMQQPHGVVQATGVSRTDIYYNAEWISGCRKAFYARYPEAIGKKVILWAPTFRGNAADPYQIGYETMLELKKQLQDTCFFILKVHPHIDKKCHLSNCDIPTEQLLPVTDLMITDYSSVLFDYLFFEQPYILYAPDLKTYEEGRGFYVPYDSLTPYVVTEDRKLLPAVMSALKNEDKTWIRKCREFHVAACDGHATERIIKILGLQR